MTQASHDAPSASWNFGWHVTDVRRNIALYQARPEVRLRPLYTTDADDHVVIGSDTGPPPKGSAPGLTKAQIAQAKANNVQPPGAGGFAHMDGPEGVLVEFGRWYARGVGGAAARQIKT